MEVGDLIFNGHEEGVVCHTDPYIMVAVNFHSYVPIRLENTRIIQKEYDKNVRIKPEIVDRIKKYLENY